MYTHRCPKWKHQSYPPRPTTPPNTGKNPNPSGACGVPKFEFVKGYAHDVR